MSTQRFLKPKDSKSVVLNLKSLMQLIEQLGMAAIEKEDAVFSEQCGYVYVTLMQVLRALMAVADESEISDDAFAAIFVGPEGEA